MIQSTLASNRKEKPVRVHWEKLGILGPVYRLVGRGFRNDEIASRLNITQDNVRRCVVWLMRFGGHSSRAELVLEAFATVPLDSMRPGLMNEIHLQ
jgi:hypothetical protein